MTSFDAGVLEPLGVGREFVDRHPFGDEFEFLQKLAYEFQRSRLVSLGLNQGVKHFALGIDGAPQVRHAAGDLQIHLIEMPGRMRSWSAFSEFRADPRSEVVHPAFYLLYHTLRLGHAFFRPPLAMSVLQKAIRRGVKTSRSARRLACRATHLTSSGGASAVCL